jgi:uncharacterized protein YndB with AHSA1/START domain
MPNTATATSTDRIEKTLVLRAPKARVWRAITTPEEFGTWFKVKLEGAFIAGRTTIGKITHPGFENLTMEMHVERIEPEDFFSYRWHPYAIDPKVDYSKEPTTLVEFRLEEVPGGTMITIAESGFDKIPAERRAEAFRMNDKGWAGQIENIRRHVEG